MPVDHVSVSGFKGCKSGIPSTTLWPECNSSNLVRMMQLRSGRIWGKLFVRSVLRARMKPTPSVPRRSNQLKPCLRSVRKASNETTAENLHCVDRLQHLLRGSLQREHRIRRIVELFDLLWIRNKHISIVRSREFERLSVGLVECILNHIRAPEEERPSLIAPDKGSEDVPKDLG